MIEMNIPSFGKDNFIHRQTYSRNTLDYNTRVDVSGNCKVVYFDGKGYKRLRKSDNYIINPKQISFFNKLMHKSTKDPNAYEVYFINTSIVNGKWGTNVEVHNDHMKELEYVKYFIYVEYDFCVSDNAVETDLVKYLANRFDLGDSCSEDMVRKTVINSKIQDVIQATCCKYLNKMGYVKFNEAQADIINEINETLNMNKFYNLGVELTINNIKATEDPEKGQIRDHVEMKNYLKNNAAN